MQNNDKYIDRYFDDVERFSVEHKKDMETFNRLLDNLMRNNKEDRYQKDIVALKNIINNFNNYLERNNIVLSKLVKNYISALADAGYTPIVKKRMIEDIIHKIKSRIESQKKKKFDEKKIQMEIDELHASRHGIIDWFKLTKFALEYGTITLFSHYIKDTSLSIIRKKAVLWLEIIDKSIKNILDTKYYLLSALEYNSLELILRLRKPVYAICGIDLRNYYDPWTIADSIDSFAKVYLTLINNTEYVEFSFNKAFKEDKTNHGLWGALKNFLDQPIYNNMLVERTDYEIICNSITGFLLSYYTVREKIIIKSVHQIMYLLAIDGKLDFKKKYLTKEAAEQAGKVKNQKSSDEAQAKKNLDDMNTIIDNYLKMGPYYEERIFKVEAKKIYHEFMTEIKNKPLLRIIKLTEGYIKYFIDLIVNYNNFILEYDNNEYDGYFEIKPGLYDIASKYNMRQFELVGSKLKEMENMTSNSGGTSDGILHVLTDPNLSRLASNPKVNFARLVLSRVSDLSYRAGVSLSELIFPYYNQKEAVFDDNKSNYDFFLNAVIKRKKNFALNKVFKKDEISLREFLEAACSLAFHICHILNNPSLKNMIKERDEIESEMEKGQTDLLNPIAGESCKLEFDEKNSVLSELDEIYRDNLTKLWKVDYLNDQVLSKLYNDKFEYKFDTPRFLFMGAIIGFDGLNNIYGHSNVDKLLTEISRIIYNYAEKPGKNIDDVVIRYDAGTIIGFLNDLSLMAAVDLLRKINEEINMIPREKINFDILEISLNFGIYEERKKSNHGKNIEIVKKIVNITSIDKVNGIGFIRDLNYIVTERDFDNNGEIKNNLITVVK